MSERSVRLDLIRQAVEGSRVRVKPYPEWVEKIQPLPRQSFPDDTRLADLARVGKPIAVTFGNFLQESGLVYRESEDVILAINEAANPLINGQLVLPPKDSLTIAEFRELLRDPELPEKLALFSDPTRREILIRMFEEVE